MAGYAVMDCRGEYTTAIFRAAEDSSAPAYVIRALNILADLLILLSLIFVDWIHQQMQGKLITELLSSAQAHVPALGFTVAAIKAGAQQNGLASTSTVSNLFPSHTATARSLLQRFDELYWEGLAKIQQERGLRDVNEQSRAFEEAIQMVESKLHFSAAVKDKLPDALGALVSSTSTSFLPITLPNPSPILHRAYSIADEALHLAGWTGSLSTDWYSKRIALTNSFMLAELHMISPEQQDQADVSASIQLFRRLSPTSKAQSSRETSFPQLGQWGKWGAQGWLGILRSRGL